MNQHIKQILQDLMFLTLSIFLSFFALENGLITKFVLSIGDLHWIGVIFAGMFFTSVFTTAPAILVLGELSHTTSLPILVILGGLGAVLGDYVIFRFIKDRVSEDFSYIFLLNKKRYKFFAIFKIGLFKYFVPFLGALIIASPLPDELGVTMLGLSNLNDKTFFLVSFFSNSFGILIIALFTKFAIGV